MLSSIDVEEPTTAEFGAEVAEDVNARGSLKWMWGGRWITLNSR